METFHFIFQLQSRCEFMAFDTAKEAAEFCDNMGSCLSVVHCYLSNLRCYISIEVGLIQPRIRREVLDRIQRWLNSAYEVGKSIEV